jgi:integrase
MAHPGTLETKRPLPLVADTVLLDGNLRESSKQLYMKALLQFIAWFRYHNFDTSNDDDFDILLNNYFAWLYTINGGGGRALAQHTLHGLVWKIPRYKRGLHIARRALDGWLRLVPTNSYPPLSFELTVVLAQWLAHIGRIDMAVGTLLGFDCLLRVSEMVNIRRCDIVDDSNGDMVIVFNGTKTTDSDRKQYVTVLNNDVKLLVRQLIFHLPPNSKQKIFWFTKEQYGPALKKATVAYGVDHIGYVPHSLRHGGATYYYCYCPERKLSVDDLLLRGRWKSVESTRRYIQGERAHLLRSIIPDSIHHLGTSIIKSGIMTSIIKAYDTRSIPPLHLPILSSSSSSSSLASSASTSISCSSSLGSSKSSTKKKSMSIKSSRSRQRTTLESTKLFRSMSLKSLGNRSSRSSRPSIPTITIVKQ